jgi:hypothetical protein
MIIIPDAPIAKLNEGNDIDNYRTTFERVAQTYEWSNAKLNEGNDIDNYRTTFERVAQTYEY